jgi:hypothetical protein
MVVTIIGFVGLVVNLLTDHQMAPQSASEKELLLVKKERE